VVAKILLYAEPQYDGHWRNLPDYESSKERIMDKKIFLNYFEKGSVVAALDFVSVFNLWA
jgi:hypothetical protein